MKPVECEFEQEVLRAVLEARWPERTDADLVAHIGDCGICSDIVVIAGAIEKGRTEISAPGNIPDSGVVWWLAQRRARLEAAKTANRPIHATQAIALVCAITLLCADFGALRVRFEAVLGRVAWGDAGIAGRFAMATRLLAAHGGLAIAMTAVLLLIPAAAYLAIGRE